jgi:hypothetical protein
VLPLLVGLTALGVRGVVPDSWVPEAVQAWGGGDAMRGFVQQQQQQQGPGFNAGSMQVAKEEEDDDPVNHDTIVEPLPADLKRFHRPVVTVRGVGGGASARKFVTRGYSRTHVGFRVEG